MKKLSLKQKVRNTRKSIRGNRPKKFFSKALVAKKQYDRLSLPDKAKLSYTEKGATLIAPENFNLSNDAEEVLSFLKVLRRVCSVNVRLYVDFTKIKSMSPMCALLLTSEIDRWRKYGERKLRVVDRDQWSPVVKKLLSEMGFNELIKPSDSFIVPPEEHHVKYLRLQSGTYGDAEIAENLSEKLSKMAGSFENAHLLHEGLTEAMINSKKWAYTDSDEAANKRWWLTGSYNSQTGTGIVMIYDHGVGIPKTLPKSGLVENYKALLESWGISNPNDAYWIKAAMTLGRTASGLKHRGKGLRDIQQFVLASKKGMLRVVSGYGEYMIDHNGEEASILHENPLNGTLIAWQINSKEN